MGRITSVSLGNYFDIFIEEKISEGRYKNTSEVIRAGLRLLKEDENRAKTLKSAIQEGIDRGMADKFNPQKHLQQLKANKNY